MQIGEVIALLTKFAANLENDPFLMANDVYDIEDDENGVNLFFVNASTSNYRIDKNGEKTYL